MKATIRYSLSEAGRKASLIAGGDGKREQVVTGDVDATALDLLSVSSDGVVSGDATREEAAYGRVTKEFDAPQSFDDLLAIMRTWKLAETAKAAAEAAKCEGISQDSHAALTAALDACVSALRTIPDILCEYKHYGEAEIAPTFYKPPSGKSVADVIRFALEQAEKARG